MDGGWRDLTHHLQRQGGSSNARGSAGAFAAVARCSWGPSGVSLGSLLCPQTCEKINWDILKFLRVFFFFFFFFFWLCWVFVSVRGLSPVAASGGHTSSRCAGLSLSRPLLLWSTGSRRAGSAIVAHGPSHSAACGIFPDQGPNPCPLHWQADSQPLRHQGSPKFLRVYLSKTQFKSISAKPEVVRSSLKEIISSGEKYLYG